MSAKNMVIKKKIKPYPFEASLEAGATKLIVHIRRLTLKGFIADMGKGMVKIGTQHEIRFELPTMEVWILSPVKVMKTYDRLLEASDKKGSKVERLAEFQFTDLAEDHKVKISRFLTAIRQV